MKEEERKLMMKIADEVEAIKNRKWFKRLDQEELSGELKSMTADPNVPMMQIKSKSGEGVANSTPTWQITTNFKTTDIQSISDNKIIHEELKKHIFDICRQHGITRMTIYYDESGATVQLKP